MTLLGYFVRKKYLVSCQQPQTRLTEIINPSVRIKHTQRVVIPQDDEFTGLNVFDWLYAVKLTEDMVSPCCQMVRRHCRHSSVLSDRGGSEWASVETTKDTPLRRQDSSHPTETFVAAPLTRKSCRTPVNVLIYAQKKPITCGVTEPRWISCSVSQSGNAVKRDKKNRRCFWALCMSTISSAWVAEEMVLKPALDHVFLVIRRPSLSGLLHHVLGLVLSLKVPSIAPPSSSVAGSSWIGGAGSE